MPPILFARSWLLVAGLSTVAACGRLDAARAPHVATARVPNGGIQPQATFDAAGVLHLIYFAGDAGAGDLFYVRSRDLGKTFSAPLRVNSQPGSAIAAGTIRGAQIALGRNGRLHVAWNGSANAEPKGPVNPKSAQHGMPMLYTRLTGEGRAFEPQRNLMQRTFGLDGGGAIAADRNGRVYVGWHGLDAGSEKHGEDNRRVWIAQSQDEGASFGAEAAAWDTPTGACGCCGMGLFADQRGTLYGLYRSATEVINRDIYVLVSRSGGARFEGSRLHPWQLSSCPMSSMAFAQGPGGVLGAWETAGQVYFSRFDRADEAAPTGPLPVSEGRKHPRLAVNRGGQALLVWTEGTGWNRGGSLAWQAFEGRAPAGDRGTRAGVPVWSFGAATARPDGGFLVLY